MTSEETSTKESSGLSTWRIIVIVGLGLTSVLAVLAVVIIAALIAVGSSLESTFSKVEEGMHQQQMQNHP